MKRYLFLFFVLFGSIPLSSQSYVYDKYGNLKYLVSDSLLISNPVKKAGVFMEHHTTRYYRLGSYDIGYSTAKVFKQQEGVLEIVDTLYTPILMDKEVSLESIKTFRAYVQYVNENYSSAETYVKYDYVDDSIDVLVRVSVEPVSGKWRLLYKKEEYKIDALSSLISKLDKLISDYSKLIDKP